MSLFLIEKRFGTIAVDRGYITTGQLIEALGIQHRENLSRIRYRPVAQILLDLGYMNATQFRVVLDQMGLPLALFHLLIQRETQKALPETLEAGKRPAGDDTHGQ